MTPADARDETDATLERLRFDLWVLMTAARYAERRARRLQAAQRRPRCVGLVDLIASAQAYESQRQYLATARRTAIEIGRLIDRQNGDELATVEAAIRNELTAERMSPDVSERDTARQL